MKRKSFAFGDTEEKRGSHMHKKMIPLRKKAIAILVVSLFELTARIHGATWSWPLETYPKEGEINAVEQKMRFASDSDLREAEDQMAQWFYMHEVPWDVNGWLGLLYARGRFQDVADLSLLAINSRPSMSVYDVGCPLQWRTKALLALNQPEGALAAAKGFYNICAWKQTESAIRLVAICMAKCHPDQKDIADQFLHEQALASTAPMMANMPGKSLTVETRLKSVKVDPALYQSGLSEWEKRPDFDDRINYADLLLVADQASAAERVFSDLLADANTQNQANTAYEGIVRALRAEDGNLRRANARVMSNSSLAK